MQTLLFDLGGVVVDYRGPERLAALSGGAMSVEEAHAAMAASSTLHAFERGQMTPDAFGQSMVEEWRLEIAPDLFVADFETWPERLYPGVVEMIESLRGKARLACLSNINIPHWRQAERLGLGALFEHEFLSHEMGARKPERKIYDTVIAALDVPAEAIIFFDDVKANIDAAHARGMATHHIATPNALVPILEQYSKA